MGWPSTSSTVLALVGVLRGARGVSGESDTPLRVKQCRSFSVGERRQFELSFVGDPRLVYVDPDIADNPDYPRLCAQPPYLMRIYEQKVCVVASAKPNAMVIMCAPIVAPDPTPTAEEI